MRPGYPTTSAVPARAPGRASTTSRSPPSAGSPGSTPSGFHGTLNDVPPSEYEAAYDHQTETSDPVGIQRAPEPPPNPGWVSVAIHTWWRREPRSSRRPPSVSSADGPWRPPFAPAAEQSVLLCDCASWPCSCHLCGISCSDMGTASISGVVAQQLGRLRHWRGCSQQALADAIAQQGGALARGALAK